MMRQNLKKLLPEAPENTNFYVTLITTYVVVYVALFGLSRLIMGAVWIDRNTGLVMGTVGALAVLFAEVVARHISLRAKK